MLCVSSFRLNVVQATADIDSHKLHVADSPAYLPTFTNRLLYLILFIARPLGFFFFSCFATFGVCPLTLPARAKDPCTLPASQTDHIR